MSKPALRVYSSHTIQAMALFGKLIREARIERKIPATELAERAGISRGLLHRIERGDLKCEIGAAFEVATLLGLPLFSPEGLATYIQRVDEKLALLPRYARSATPELKDDF